VPLSVCFSTAATSIYFWASLLYVAYTAQILAIDYCSNMHGSDATLCDQFGWRSINKQARRHPVWLHHRDVLQHNCA
jgi:hypothetical protein